MLHGTCSSSLLGYKWHMESVSTFAMKTACAQSCLCSAAEWDAWSWCELCALAIDIRTIVIMEQKYPWGVKTELWESRCQREHCHHRGYIQMGPFCSVLVLEQEQLHPCGLFKRWFSSVCWATILTFLLPWELAPCPLNGCNCKRLYSANRRPERQTFLLPLEVSFSDDKLTRVMRAGKN